MYKSPIEVIADEMKFRYDNEIIRAVQRYDIKIDKDELVRALEYDRHQYEKGYADGKLVAMEKLVRCCVCKHCKIITDSSVGSATWHCSKAYGLPDVDPTDFCSRGERKEE